ncbi:MAG: thioredoxin family protein [Ferruginibacter sp.]|nr:thioredoxin family protein [Ferruginibacter sp.]
MKKTLLALLFLAQFSTTIAQEKKLYNPDANAIEDIAYAIEKAKAQNKFVLIQAGGNWCSWCIEFARFCKASPKIDSLINSSFVWYHLNYSKENKNSAAFRAYGYPQRFGFPVFVILDSYGRQIHTQNSEYFENGKKSYDEGKVFDFLSNWTPNALKPELYKD